jgi:hypothetical protein
MKILRCSNPIALRAACFGIALHWLTCLAWGSVADAGKLNEETAPASAVYVDGRIGLDSNPGTEDSPVRSIARAAAIVRRPDNAIYTMKLLPGIHVLEKPVSLTTEKDLSGKRIVVEAATLPDDPSWTPEKMPIVINSSNLGDFSTEVPSYVVSFAVDESHVTIEGIKFPGYARPNARYYPIARFNKAKTDLRVQRCLFVGEKDASHLHVGVLAHGNDIKIDRCVFYYANNAVVFWMDSGDNLKTGNALTHSIIVGAGQSAVWTAAPDKDFTFRHNIVTRCKHVWVRNESNPSTYALEDCILVDNQYRTAVAHEGSGVRPEAFELAEHNVTKTGEIALRFVDNVDQPLPRDYLHPLPGSPAHDLNAGLFSN